VRVVRIVVIEPFGQLCHHRLRSGHRLRQGDHQPGQVAIQQAATAMLAQANQSGQSVLALLK